MCVDCPVVEMPADLHSALKVGRHVFRTEDEGDLKAGTLGRIVQVYDNFAQYPYVVDWNSVDEFGAALVQWRHGPAELSLTPLD